MRAHFDDTPLGAAPKWWTAMWAFSRYRRLLIDLVFDTLWNGSFYVRLPASRDAAAKAATRFRHGWYVHLAALVILVAAAVIASAAAVYSNALLMIVAVPLLVLTLVTTGWGYQLLLTNDVNARREGDRMTLLPHPRFAEELVRINPPDTIQVEHVRWDAPAPAPVASSMRNQGLRGSAT